MIAHHLASEAFEATMSPEQDTPIRNKSAAFVKKSDRARHLLPRVNRIDPARGFLLPLNVLHF